MKNLIRLTLPLLVLLSCSTHDDFNSTSISQMSNSEYGDLLTEAMRQYRMLEPAARTESSLEELYLIKLSSANPIISDETVQKEYQDLVKEREKVLNAIARSNSRVLNDPEEELNMSQVLDYYSDIIDLTSDDVQFLLSIETLSLMDDKSIFESDIQVLREAIANSDLLSPDNRNAYLDLTNILEEFKLIQWQIENENGIELTEGVASGRINGDCYGACDEVYMSGLRNTSGVFVFTGGISLLTGNLLGLGVSVGIAYWNLQANANTWGNCYKNCD